MAGLVGCMDNAPSAGNVDGATDAQAPSSTDAAGGDGASALGCGDGTCNGGETCSSCPADCGVCAPSCPSGYYFSSSTGDDTRSAAQAKNPNTPWKTLAKLSAVFGSFQPGDCALLNRGDVFEGSITVSASGSGTSPIVVGAYGNGARPVITGFKTVTNWVSAANGVYESTDPSFGSTVNMVTVNDAFQPIGRWPKVTAANGGYLTVDSSSGSNSLTSSALSGAPSFVGGEVVYRPEHWILNRRTVTGQSSSTATFTQTNAAYAPRVGYGFFFQNHVNALTALGEWAYVPATQKLQMYFGSSGPGSHAVKASVVENLINLPTDLAYITFDNLALTGANTSAFSMGGTTIHDIQINNSDISYTGVDAVFVAHQGSNHITVASSTISYTNNNGITAQDSTGWIVKNDVFSDTAMTAGMGQSEDGQYIAVDVSSDSLVDHNVIGNTGYLGIHYAGSNTTIQNNYVHHYCLVKDDGGGIYTYSGNSPTNSGTNRKVLNNIVLYGGSVATDYGTNGVASGVGLYIDGAAAHIELSGNTVAFVHGAGIHFNSGSDDKILNNTFFDNDVGFDYDGIQISNVQVNNITQTGNVFVAQATSQFIGAILISATDTLTAWGTWDDNIYGRPILEPQGIVGTYSDTQGIISIGVNATYHHYSLDTWKSISGQDANTTKSPVTISNVNDLRFEYNASNLPKTVNLGANYIDFKSTAYPGTVTLAPWTSVVLIKN